MSPSDKSSNTRGKKRTGPLLSSSHRAAVVGAILRWYRRRGRSLPWRNISNPYRILLSEIMLQQTQVNRVLLKYPKFLRRFPSIRKLAAAKQKDIVIAWRGMGYNNRAVRLHRLAQMVVNNYNGRVPDTYEDLIELPGIGKYTANALLVSAFRQTLPVVDVNVRRVLSRIFWRSKTTTQTRSEDEVSALAEKLLPSRNAYGWNQALMDLGATVCTAHTPQCHLCPVAVRCTSTSVIKKAYPTPIRVEPSNDGVPNRIYRGRVIETLRRNSGRRRITVDSVGRAIHPHYSGQHRTWLNSLITGLEKDGLIRRSKSGRWRERHITLA